MSEAVHTSITLALVSGIIMAFVGVLASRFALEVMGTPSDVIGQSVTYMKIYFLGMPFFMLYNYGAAILRAVGDTRRPLIFLAFAGMANVGLDLLLVIVIPLDVAGVAIGTITSQFIILYSCAALPVEIGEQLSAPFFQAVHPVEIPEAYFPGRHPGRHSKYSHQLLQRHAAVICKFLRLHSHGGIYGGKQHPQFPVCGRKRRNTGVHELYQPELQRRKAEEDGQGVF